MYIPTIPRATADLLRTSALIVISLLVVGGCVKNNTRSNSAQIEIVSVESIDTTKEKATSGWIPGPGKYEQWERLHEAVRAILVEHGTVSWDPKPLPDFYFSGDWFHENSDGFGVGSPDPISKELLLSLQRMLADDYKDAILEFNGLVDPIEGLVMFVTSKRILVGWTGMTRDACEKRLHDVGLNLD